MKERMKHDDCGAVACSSASELPCCSHLPVHSTVVYAHLIEHGNDQVRKVVLHVCWRWLQVTGWRLVHVGAFVKLPHCGIQVLRHSTYMHMSHTRRCICLDTTEGEAQGLGMDSWSLKVAMDGATSMGQHQGWQGKILAGIQLL